MGWTARTRQLAWQRLLLDPELSRLELAREFQVDPKSIRDLIADMEAKSGLSLPQRRRGRPRRVKPHSDFEAVARAITSPGSAQDRLVLAETLRAALRRRIKRTSRRHLGPEDRLVQQIVHPSALALLLSFTGHPQVRESDYVDFEAPAEIATDIMKAARLANTLSPTPKPLKFRRLPDGGVHITSEPQHVPPHLVAMKRPTELAIGHAALLFHHVKDPTHSQRLDAAKRIVGAMRRELRRLSKTDRELHLGVRSALKWREMNS